MADDNSSREQKYVDILMEPVEVSGEYLPKMGQKQPVDIDGFQEMYGNDPFYHWIGLDSPLMFAAHKAAGGMTSIYRQIGTGSERLFRAVLRDELSLTQDQVMWSYEILPSNPKDAKGKPRLLHLDGRVELDDVRDETARDRIDAWIEEQRNRLGITVPLKGAVFEVRQGYKSADSKRQNGDLANAAQAISHGYLPVLVFMSTQVNHVVEARYRVGNWGVLTGTLGEGDKYSGTFDFMNEVIGYDLVSFFERNSETLRSRVEVVLSKLLEAK